MNTTRRTLLQRAGAGSLLGFWPFSKMAGAKRDPAGIYDRLGIRPIVNFQGTHTTIGASKMWPELHEAMGQASQHYVPLQELQEKVGERLARLIGTEAAMVTTGASGAITLGACAIVAGEDVAKVRRLPDLTGMKTEAVIQKAHRNVYDRAIRSVGLRVVEVASRAELLEAIGPQTAMMYFLGGTSHDWEYETPVSLEECLSAAHKAGFPVMVDAANMLPPWDNLRKLAAAGVDLICVSGGKHMRGPQCSGILAGRKDLIRAAWRNSSPHSDSFGRPMKAGREEIVGVWLAAEKYSRLDFEALDRECARQADFLIASLSKIGGVKAGRTPFDRTRRVHRVHVQWDEAGLGITAREMIARLREGDPPVAVLGGTPDGIELTVFMNEPGDEKIAARRIGEVFAAARKS